MTVNSRIKLVAALAISGAAMANSVDAAPPPAGNADRGGQVYQASCGSCHSLDANRAGPSHRGVFGRRAGRAAGFSYSPALRHTRIVWDTRTLDQWLRNPQALVPGTTMGFRLGDPGRRADVIAFLQRESQTPARR